jgi:hypothetical protein
MKATAVCTWGDGPDILMSLEGLNKKNQDRYYDLSIEEAKDLIRDLSNAVIIAEELEETCINHDNCYLEDKN